MTGDIRGLVEEAQNWAAWFAAERDFYLADYDENARWHHRRTAKAESTVGRVRKLAEHWRAADSWHGNAYADDVLDALDWEA